MKKLVLFCLAFCFLAMGIFAGQAMAQEKQATITFGWNQPNADDPNLAGWKFYMSKLPNVEVVPANLFSTILFDQAVRPGETTEFEGDTVLMSPEGQEVTYYFVVTAFGKNDLESGKSNEVSTTIDFRIPGAPTSFKVTFEVKPQ
jgi:hypothetical protein